MSFKFDKVGKLTKIGARRHNWNDREFGLSLQHKTMWYFKTAQSRDDFIKTASEKGSSFDPVAKGAAQGIIPLTEGYAYSADYVETKEWSWCIELFTPGRYHYLCASSKDEMMEWIHLMCRCGVTFRSTRAISLPDDIKAKQSRAKHGFLLKRGELNTGFKKRLFRALTSGNGEIRVEYFESIHDDKPKGAIDMKEAKLVFEPNSLDIVIKTSNRNWVLRADDAKIREDWILYFEGKLTKEEQKEAEEKAAKEKAEREAKEAAEKAAREAAEAKAKAEREAEERRRKASEDRKAAEAAEAARKAAEEAEEARRRKESEDRKEQERIAREKAEQEERDRKAAAEKAAAEKAAQDNASKAAKDKAEKDAADKAAKEKAEKEAKDKADREKTEAEAKAKAAAVAPKPETKAAPVVLPEAFTKGTKMIKIPRSGDPAESELKLEVGSDGDMRVTWASKKKKADEAAILLRTCTLVLGQTAGQFKERPKVKAKVADKSSLSFSLLGASRSLDLICNTSDDYRTWMRELTKHVAKVQNLAGLAFGA